MYCSWTWTDEGLGGVLIKRKEALGIPKRERRGEDTRAMKHSLAIVLTRKTLVAPGILAPIRSFLGMRAEMTWERGTGHN